MSIQHVYPLRDAADHDIYSDSTDCVCGPAIKFVDGGMVVVHHSLDGREMCDDCKRERATTYAVGLNETDPGLQFCDDCAPNHGMFPGEDSDAR